MYNLEYGIFQIPKPDCTFILKTSAEFSLKLAHNITDKYKQKRRRAYLGNSNKQDILEKDKNHQENALNSYLVGAKEFPRDFKVIECIKKGKLLAPGIINLKVVKVIEKRIS